MLHWSENEAVAKKLQEEMAALIGKLSKIGTATPKLDTESAIHLAIEDTKVSDDFNSAMHTFIVVSVRCLRAVDRRFRRGRGDSANQRQDEK